MDKQIKLEKRLEISKDFDPVSYEEWKEKVVKDLKGKPFEKLITKTYEGIHLQPIYTKNDVEGLPQTESTPGFSNYIRGTKAEGYTNGGWEVAQELQFGDAEEFNKALKNDLAKGQTAINLNLDSASMLGLDADSAETEHVGDIGLSIAGINSFSRVFEGIDITKYPLYILSGFSSLPMLCILGAYCKNNNIDLTSLSGSVEADPYSFLISKGNLPVDQKFVFDKMATSIKWINHNTPNIRSIGVTSLPYNSAGATAVQELAYTMATAVEYIDELLDRGLTIDKIAPQFRFTFGVGPNYFMEIAKFRAARVMWSNIIDAFGGSDESKKIMIHGRTSAINQTLYDPYVNMLRSTTEAFSAVIGGVDSLHTSPFDETLGESDNFSRRIARNIQIILDEEANLSKLIDPAGGSYYVESLTKQLAEEAWREFQQVEKDGGMLKSLNDEIIHEKIEESFQLKIKDVRKRKNVIIGSNMYANPKEGRPKKNRKAAEAFAKKRAEFIAQYRVAGKAAEHAKVLSKLGEIVKSSESEIVDHGIEAVQNGATIGELTKVIRSMPTTGIEVQALPVRKLSFEFDQLKNMAFEIEEKRGKKPTIALLTMGTVKQYKARADFARGFFETGGVNVLYPNGFENTGKAVDYVKSENPDAVVICSVDDNYPELVPPLTKEIKGLNDSISVILAGYPKEQVDAHREAGVDDFIFLGADAYTIISNLLSRIGG